MYLYLGMLTLGVFVTGGGWTILMLSISNNDAPTISKPVTLISVEEAREILSANKVL